MPTSVSVAGQMTLWGRKSTNWPETRKCCSWKESRSVHWSLITTNHHFFSLLLIILWLPLTFRSVMTFLIRPKKYRNWSVRSGAVTPNWIMLPTAWTSSTRDLDTSSAGTWWVPYQTWLLSESLHCPLKHFNFNPFFSLSAAPPSATHQPHAGELRPGKNRSWTSLGAEVLSVSQPIPKSLTLIMTPFSSIIPRACSFLLPSFTVRTWSSNTSTWWLSRRNCPKTLTS